MTGVDTVVNKERKVFCVGFNKTGTVTLHVLLRDSLGLRSAHEPEWTDWSFLGDKVELDRFDAFSDGGCCSVEALDTLYPDALFVLNTRPLQHWVLSRHKAVERSKAMTRWALSEYVPLGLLASMLNRWILDNSEKAVLQWVSLRNSYHRHVLEFFANRSDKLLVLDIENPDAANQLARFLGCDADLEAEVLHQQGEGSITGLLLNAIGSTPSPENSAIEIERIFARHDLAAFARNLTCFESDIYKINPTFSDRILRVFPFLGVPVRWMFIRSVGLRARSKSVFAKWLIDYMILMSRSGEDMSRFTSVRRIASASK
jgi:hypothetical protein